MSAYLTRIIQMINSAAFLLEPNPKTLSSLAERFGETGKLLDSFYRLCDGGFFFEGDYFRSPSGKRYDIRIPRSSEISLIAEVMYVDAFFLESEFSRKTVAFVDRGDGDWVGACEHEGKLIFVDFFHEIAGTRGTGTIVAESIEDFFAKLMEFKGAYWLEDDFLRTGCLF